MARLPKFCALLRLGRPVERTAAELGRDLAEAARLLGNAGVTPVELDEQHWRLRQRQLRIGVRRLYLQLIEQLDARNRNTGLDGDDRGVAGGLDRREWTHARRDRFRNAGKPQRQLDNDAKRSFRADH